MQVFHSWKESLQIFYPSVGKLYLFATIKSLFQTYRLLLYYFWWLMLLVVLGDGLLFYTGIQFPQEHLRMSWSLIGYLLFMLLAHSVLLFGAFLCARPSLRKKDSDYLIEYSKHYFLVFLLARMVLGMVPVIFTIFVLFLLDTQLSVREFFNVGKRTAVMIFYNLPFFALIGLVAFILRSLLMLAAGMVITGYFFFTQMLGVFFVFTVPLICILNTFYIKRVHEQGELYY